MRGQLFFFLNLSTLFIILLSPKYKILRFSILAISILLIFIISQKYPIYKERIFDQTISQLNISSDKKENIIDQIKNKKIFIFSHKHHQHYLSAYKIFLDNKIFGIGPKNFRNICKNDKYFINEYSCTTHPHNTYIQLLAETGLVGFIIIFSTFSFLIILCLKQFVLQFLKKDFVFNSYQIFLLSAIFITLWPFAPSEIFSTIGLT